MFFWNAATKVPKVIHRERLTKHTDSFITVQDVEQAKERAASWVRYNIREWPYEHRLDYRIEGNEMLFWFARE